ncbi:MAG: UDP-N-acetylglucosamine--N-acetylmuramyl-(pentapeptide) pyrophosphoryl-undecaprenol N-acetylglucosamine transferase [bacterium]|nr:UDP-N-acetylglucosamine--N-acetylmuramyl-(pentapeptide) pyrophosphoryl-undecaprenol N-acetylglucosamine transferase [bacterium]
MKILVTGTHFTPAQAVIEELQKWNGTKIVYIGRKFTREGDDSSSAESQVLPKMGVKFLPLTTGRLQRKFTIYTIPSILKIPFGFFQALYFLLREQPEVVLSFGGYVAVPTVFAAWLLSVPVIIHEQTLVSGLANTISSWFADKVAVSFPDNTLAKSRSVLTGNPMRQELISTDGVSFHEQEIKEVISLVHKEELPLILVTGGNQGSHVINEALGEVLEELTEQALVIHQTGDSKFQDFAKLEAKKNGLKHPQRYVVRKWIEGSDMGNIFKNAGLVVARAGANTLLELSYFQVPALVIPLPYISRDEQNINAKFFQRAGLAKILPQSELSGKRLLEDITQMLKDLPELKREASRAKSLVIPDAAKRLALETLTLIRQREIA